MVIIFAGCDCTGKSTCFDFLKRDYEGEFYKGLKLGNLNDRIEELKIYLKENNLVVHDRYPLFDDMVYSPIFTNKESEIFTSGKFEEVKGLLNECRIIYFTCDNSEIKRRMSERGDEYINPEQVDSIKYNYDKIFNILGHLNNLTIIDTTNLAKEEVYNKVKEVVTNV